MSNVRVLDPSPQPSKGVVDILRHLLEQAEKGEVCSVAVAYETRAEATGHYFSFGKRTLPMALVGELDLLKFSIFVGLGRVHPPE